MTHPTGPAGSGPSGGAGTGPNRIRRPRPTAPRRLAISQPDDMPVPWNPPGPGPAPQPTKTFARGLVHLVRAALSPLAYTGG